MRIAIELDGRLPKEALALTKTKQELIHRSLHAVIRQQRIERLMGKLGRLPLDLTPKVRTKLRTDG